MKKKTNTLVDILKFVASVFIFTMHCNALGDLEHGATVVELMSRWGVPYFFLCTAFFLYSKSENGVLNPKTLKKYILRIAMLYLIWFIINLPNIYYKRFYQKNIASLSTWLIFIKNSILSSTFSGSWFLLSCIFSAWIVFGICTKFQTNTLMWLTFILYLLCVFSSNYYGLLPAEFGKILDFLCYPLNIFNGCFYFSLGKYIFENQSKLFGIFTKKKSIFIFFISYFFYIVEVAVSRHYGILKGTDVAFSTALIAFSLFLFSLQINIDIKNSLLFRKISTIIYCSQANVLLVNNYFKLYLHWSSLMSFLISASMIAVIVILVLHIQTRNRWKFVKYLS